MSSGIILENQFVRAYWDEDEARYVLEVKSETFTPARIETSMEHIGALPGVVEAGGDSTKVWFKTRGGNRIFDNHTQYCLVAAAAEHVEKSMR